MKERRYNEETNPKKDYITCLECPSDKNYKHKRNFYALNPSSKKHRKWENIGKVPICIHCLRKKCFYENGKTVNMQGLLEALEWLDIPFKKSVYLDIMRTGDFDLGNYKSRMNLGYRKETFENSDMKEFNDIKEEMKSNNNNEMIFSKEWRGTYSPFDLEYLNDYYRDLNDDFKIYTKNHKDYARKIAKASLAMDKAYEDMLNGVSGADKKYKDLKDTFDQLSKSAQFSENTRTGIDAGISGISQIVDKIENKEWIYELEDFKKDALDHLYDQFKNIEKSI